MVNILKQMTPAMIGYLIGWIFTLQNKTGVFILYSKMKVSAVMQPQTGGGRFSGRSYILDILRY